MATAYISERILELPSCFVAGVRKITSGAHRRISHDQTLDRVAYWISIPNDDNRIERIGGFKTWLIARPLHSKLVDRTCAENVIVREVIRVGIDVLCLKCILQFVNRCTGSPFVILSAKLKAKRKVIVLKQLGIEASCHDVASVRRVVTLVIGR